MASLRVGASLRATGPILLISNMGKIFRHRGGFISPALTRGAVSTAKRFGPYARYAARVLQDSSKVVASKRKRGRPRKVVVDMNNVMTKGITLYKMLSKHGMRHPENQSDADTNNVTHSYSVFGRRMSRRNQKIMRAISPQLTITGNTAGRLFTGTANTQAVGSNAYATGVDLSTFVTQGSFNIGNNPVSLGGSGAGTQLRARFEYVEGDLYFQNASNLGCILDIYECFPKHDVANTYTPSQCFTQGISEVTTKSGGVSAATMSLRPFDSPLFTTFWYVRKVRSLNMPAAAGHVHHWRRYINKTTSVERTISGIVTGHTIGFLYVARGLPVHDSTTIGSVALGPVALDIACQWKLVGDFTAAQSNVIINRNTPVTISTAAQVLLNTVVESNVIDE